MMLYRTYKPPPSRVWCCTEVINLPRVRIWIGERFTPYPGTGTKLLQKLQTSPGFGMMLYRSHRTPPGTGNTRVCTPVLQKSVPYRPFPCIVLSAFPKVMILALIRLWGHASVYLIRVPSCWLKRRILYLFKNILLKGSCFQGKFKFGRNFSIFFRGWIFLRGHHFPPEICEIDPHSSSLEAINI